GRGWDRSGGRCRHGLRRRKGQSDVERRAAARLTGHRDGTAVGFDDSLDEAQTQAEAPFGPARVTPEKTFPDSREVVAGDADAGVTDAQDGAPGFQADMDDDSPAARCVLHRVVEKVRRDLLEANAIAIDHDARPGLDDESHAFRLGDVAIEVNVALDDCVELSPFASEGQRAALGLRNVHE